MCIEFAKLWLDRKYIFSLCMATYGYFAFGAIYFSLIGRKDVLFRYEPLFLCCQVLFLLVPVLCVFWQDYNPHLYSFIWFELLGCDEYTISPLLEGSANYVVDSPLSVYGIRDCCSCY